MTYHSDFWLLIGTGAPVIALAHAVAAPSAVRQSAQASITMKQLGANVWTRFFFGWASVVYAVGGVVFTLFSFAVALWATFSESDDPGADGSHGGVSTAQLVSVMLVFSVVLLAMQIVVDQGRKFVIALLTRRSRPKPGPRRRARIRRPVG